MNENLNNLVKLTPIFCLILLSGTMVLIYGLVDNRYYLINIGLVIYFLLFILTYFSYLIVIKKNYKLQNRLNDILIQQENVNTFVEQIELNEDDNIIKNKKVMSGTLL